MFAVQLFVVVFLGGGGQWWRSLSSFLFYTISVAICISQFHSDVPLIWQPELGLGLDFGLRVGLGQIGSKMGGGGNELHHCQFACVCVCVCNLYECVYVTSVSVSE